MRTGSTLTFGVVGLLALTSLPALAGGWAAYNSAFPVLPCADGWAGCIVGTAAIGPGMQKDAAGRPVPADSRLGWFDLQPTAALSPFVTLSPYKGTLGGELAVATPAPTPVVETPPPTQPEPVAPAPVDPPRVEHPPETAVRTTPAPTPTPPRTTPTVTPTPTPTPTTARTTPTPTPTVAPTPTTARTTPTVTTPTPTPTVAPTPTTARTTPTITPPATSPTVTPPAVITPPLAASASDDSCTDLVKLEPQSMLGQLRPGQVKCIDARIGNESAQTMKDKLSRVLIANAEGKGDKAEWERLVKRHLEDIDRSDPDMCFKYATQLSRGGTGRALGVIRWADYSLENKQKWSGTTYTKRVYDLYRLKAEAANKLWAEAEDVYATKEHTDENEAKAAKWRGTTKDYAREWLDYAKASGQDTKNAMSICVSAAGNKSFCEG